MDAYRGFLYFRLSCDHRRQHIDFGRLLGHPFEIQHEKGISDLFDTNNVFSPTFANDTIVPIVLLAFVGVEGLTVIALHSAIGTSESFSSSSLSLLSSEKLELSILWRII